MNTIIEPFKIKSVEQIKFTTVKEREDILKKLFIIHLRYPLRMC